MNSIKLHFPKQDNIPKYTTEPSIDKIREMLDNLPLANAWASCNQITHQLTNLNRAPLDVQARILIMALILPSIEDIIHSLRESYVNAALPLSNKRLETAQMIQRLLSEMANGYKIIIHALLEEQQSAKHISPQLPQMIYYAMGFLSRLLVDSYALYSNEPRLIWQELNQLYLYAEKHQIHSYELSPINPENEPKPATITNTYKRIIMLAVANPYHLMQGEAVKMYQQLIEWAPSCNIHPLGNSGLPAGQLFVDLAMDAPPIYSPKTQKGIRPIEGRLLDIKKLLDTLETSIRQQGKQSTKRQQSNLTQRLERDMYQRWTMAWGARRERMSHRQSTKAPTGIICGLTSTHYYVNDKRPFTPEQDEVEIRGRNASAGVANALTLVPEEHTPWTQEQDADRLKAGINQPRKSQFDPLTNTNDKDMWIKVYASSAQVFQDFTNKDNDARPHNCHITNINQGGYGLLCPDEAKFPGRIGELLGSKKEKEETWAIGTVQWMKITEQQEISLGVRLIAEDARPVAVKAVMGIGSGSEYYRALLLPDLDPAKHPTTLITPAAIYDAGSILMLNLADNFLYARLTKQLTATSAFSHYQFELVEAPEHIRTLSENQEERKSSKLFR